MELFLDDQPIPVPESEDATIRDVILRVSDDLKETNRVVSEVIVDEVQCGDWEREPFGQRRIQEIGSLRLGSEEPRRLAVKVLYDIAKYMPRIRDNLVETSSLLQSRREEDALALLQEVMQTWSELYQGLKGSATVLGISQSSIQVGETTSEAIHEEILRLIEDASTHLEQQRFLELSDLLEYELAPKIPLVEESIYVMIREAERQPH
jgi:hypothetical protein